MKRNMSIYWIDFLVSYAVFLLGVYFLFQPTIVANVVVFFLGAPAAYRCTMFIHEIAHFSRRDARQRFFRWGWNILFGVPMLTPSCLYDSHLEHHSTNRFGTPQDPEYVSMESRSLFQLAKFVTIHTTAPMLVVFARSLLNPLLWVFPRMRKIMGERGKSLFINWDYLPSRSKNHDRFDASCLVMSTVFFYGYIAAALTGVVPLLVVAKFSSLVFVFVTLNGMRTLVAHRYDNYSKGSLDKQGQLADSINLLTNPILGGLFAPVGLRFHALHHLVPSLPYHNLARAHAELMATLPADDVYRKANVHGFRQAFAQLRQGRSEERAPQPLDQPRLQPASSAG
jgi:fatty acid desaturase